MTPRIKVVAEGREGIWIPDRESLKEFIRSKDFSEIHHFKGSGSIRIGADHDVDSVLEDIDRAERLAILTEGHENMGHALALIINNRLQCYDIGRITTDDLLV